MIEDGRGNSTSINTRRRRRPESSIGPLVGAGGLQQERGNAVPSSSSLNANADADVESGASEEGEGSDGEALHRPR